MVWFQFSTKVLQITILDSGTEIEYGSILKRKWSLKQN